MIKMITMLKRKPGLSMDEFRTYYEEHHAKLGVKYQTKMVRYLRHYLYPAAEALSGEVREPDYDVLTEVWFEDRAAYEEGAALMLEGEANAALSADEDKIFDRSKNKMVFVETCESDLSGG